MYTECELSLLEIHEGTLEILKKIIQICDEIKINYFVAFGTLLGTVRHQGFIPWDDDCDISMLAPEYEKFLEYCDLHESELYPFKIMHRGNTKNYPFSIARFCDLRYIMKSAADDDVGMGMFVDIYRYDGAGNKREEAKSLVGFKKKIYFVAWNYAARKKFFVSSKGLFFTLCRIPVYIYARIKGMNYFLDKIDKYKNLFPLEESNYIVCYWDNVLEGMGKRHYLGYEMMKFEGIDVKVPVDYETVLTEYYGDYMQLPPVEEQVPTHEYSLYRKGE